MLLIMCWPQDAVEFKYLSRFCGEQGGIHVWKRESCVGAAAGHGHYVVISARLSSAVTPSLVKFSFVTGKNQSGAKY